VANLNGLTAQYAMAQFLALTNGEQFGAWDYLYFDQFTGRTIPAKSTRREQCPVCGSDGVLGAGEPEVATSVVIRHGRAAITHGHGKVGLARKLIEACTSTSKK
jgi:hypothetical protein